MDVQYDFFIAHATLDASSAEALHDQLSVRAKVFLATRKLQPGDNWDLEIAGAMQRSRSTLVLVSQHTVAAFYERDEIAAAITQSRQSGGAHCVVPIFLDENSYVPYGLHTIHSLRVGRNGSLADIAKTLLSMDHKRSWVSSPTEDQPDYCPYKGLAAFGEGDTALFFGRAELVDQLLTRLVERRFLALIGRSGSGKTSTLRAGLLPAIRSGRLPSLAKHRIVLMTPGEHPGATLEEKLNGPSDAAILLVVDQFEEVFTRCDDQSERIDFLNSLRRLAESDGSESRVVIGLRADFYGHCADQPEFGSMVARSQVLVGPLTQAQLREAIERPARQVGLGIEPGVTDAVLAEALAEPASLPLVSHALAQTWIRRENGVLTLAGYKAAKGVEGALAATADAYVAGLGPPRQNQLRELLLQLIVPAEVGADSRRAMQRDALIGNTEGASVDELIGSATTARLLTIDETGNVELIHEALIRSWPRLRDWVNEARADLLARERLRRDAVLWDSHDRDPGYLYRRAELDTALQLGAADELGRNFLTESVQLRHRTRFAGLVGAASALLLFAIVATVLTLRWWHAREESQAKARASSPMVGILIGASEFKIDVHEVSVAQYNECVKFGPCRDRFGDNTSSNLAIDRIDALEALRFCNWIGRQLPTDGEWTQFALTRPKFIWFDRTRPEFDELDRYIPVDVMGSQPNFGNVKEWTISASEEASAEVSGQLSDDLITRGMGGEVWASIADPSTAQDYEYIIHYSDRATANAPHAAVGFRCIKKREGH
jgi:hypothetical protein